MRSTAAHKQIHNTLDQHHAAKLAGTERHYCCHGGRGRGSWHVACLGAQTSSWMLIPPHISIGRVFLRPPPSLISSRHHLPNITAVGMSAGTAERRCRQNAMIVLWRQPRTSFNNGNRSAKLLQTNSRHQCRDCRAAPQ